MTSSGSPSPVPQATPSDNSFGSDSVYFDDNNRAIDHVLTNIMRLDSTVAHKVKAWMDHRNVTSMSDLLDLYIENPDNIKDQTFRVLGTKDELGRWTCAALTILCRFATQLMSEKGTFLGNQEWLAITRQDYDAFRLATLVTGQSSHSQSTTSTPQRSPGPVTSPRASLSASQLQLATLKKSIKLDPASYPKLQNDEYIEPFWRNFQAVAKYQGMSNILDPNFVPDPNDPGATDLFDFQNSFMYSVVLNTFLTDTAKTYVREHAHDMDAQKVIGKLIKFMVDSPRTSMEIQRITSYVMTIKLDANWRGTLQQFLLHFKEQFRLLDDLLEPHERMSERMKKTLLQHAVKDVPCLSHVHTTDEYQRVLSRHNRVNYEQYYNLLLVAAQEHDATVKGNPNKRRTVYNHTLEDFDYGMPVDTQEGTLYGGIDLPIDRLYQVNKTNTVDQCPDVTQEAYQLFKAAKFGKPSFKPSYEQRPDIDGFVRLPADLWKAISADFRQQISSYNKALPRPDSPGPPKRLVHFQEMMDKDDIPPPPDPNQEGDQEQEDTANPFMAMMTEQSHLSSDDVRHLLSVNKGKRSDKVVHPVNKNPSRTVNHHVTYTFARSNTSGHSQLVDRGANGGLAGADVKVLHKTGRKVNISGIDDHELTGLDIVTCACMFETNKGRIIGIFHEYAYLGKGRSIHSPAQMEWFKADIDDKSKAIGGKQRMVTLEGYVIPFEVRGGLVYMKPLGIPTDSEMNQYPHVFLTGPHEWDPGVLDYAYASKEEWEHLGHDPDDAYEEPNFDAYGESTQRVIANLNILLDEPPPLLPRDHDASSTSTSSSAPTFKTACTNQSFHNAWGVLEHNIYNHVTKEKEPDWESLRKYFAYQPVERIKATFQATTRHGCEGTNTYMRKHFKSRNPALNVHRRNEPVATDFIFGPEPAVDNGCNTACLYIGRNTLVADAYPVKTDSQFINTLEDQIRERGAMDLLISDRAQVIISKKIKDILRAYRIQDYQSAPHHQHQNFAENRYATIKRWVNAIMNRTGAHPSLWFLCVVYVCWLLNLSASPALDNITPLQALTGQVPDISPVLCYTFNQPVFFTAPDPSNANRTIERSGRWVGHAPNVGDAMTWIILADDTHKLIYTPRVRTKEDGFSTPIGGEEDSSKPPIIYVRGRLNADDGPNGVPFPMPTFDPTDLVGRTFLLDPEDDGSRHRAKIKQIVKFEEENEHGLVDSLKVLLSIDKGDHKVEEIITYNTLLDYLDKNDAEEKDADKAWKFRAITAHQGPLLPTDHDYKGSKYNVQVQWETGEVTYEPLSLIAKDDPVTCAVYAKENDLLDEPGWKHLKRYVKTHKRLVRSVKQAKLRQARRSIKYKFGYQVARDYDEAILLDKTNGNTNWQDAIDAEISQMDDYTVFKDKGKAQWSNKKVTNAPDGYKKIRVHLVFDVKHDGRHKARLVADGHLTEAPVEDVYSGVVSLRSLRLVIFLAELNDLELWGADIGNAYLEAYTDEKVYIVAGPEFGERQGHILIIIKALYGLKTSGKRFWERLHDELKGMDFEPSKADPQVWMRPTKKGDAYEYIAVYVDDLAIASENCKEICDTLKDKCGFKLKGDGPLTYHLGCDFVREPDGVLLATPKKYIQKMLSWYETKYGGKPKKRSTPLEPNDHPELDTSIEVDENEIKDVQSMIGQFQWLTALGRFDILSGVVTLSRYRTNPRRGHVDRCRGIYGYLADFPHGGIRFRTEEPDFTNLPNQEFDWCRSVYGEVKECLPKDAPLPRGRYVVISTYKDANLYHDHVTGRALTAILHFLNATPIDWYCKRQATVETAMYGSEFVSAKTAIDQIIDLRLSLRYLGVPIRDKSYLFGDNRSVVGSSTLPQSPLKKRHHALSYHRVREAIAAKIVGFYWIDGDKNPADILSKHWAFRKVCPMLKALLFWRGETSEIPDTVATPGSQNQDKGES
jgi:hypothetical protein